MQIREIMSKPVELVRPEDTASVAAKMMRENNIGALPVTDGDRLVGMVTDRDLVTRVLADGQSPDCEVRKAMTDNILYCYDDQELEEVAHNMGEQRIRRLPVVDRDKRLVGMISLGDLARADPPDAGSALQHIARAS